MASASLFERWEQDPFFSAAEEVQESADRMESTYRTWLHSEKDISGRWNSDGVRRHLQTAVGTAKWQLEEFERAVNSSYIDSAASNAKDRHRAFISAIGNQISQIESKLNESVVSQGKPPLPWVRLDKGEYEELATFLSSSSQSMLSTDKKKFSKVDKAEQRITNLTDTDKQSEPMCSRTPYHSRDGSQVEAKPEKLYGHRRTASAGADIGSLNIVVADDALQSSSSNFQTNPPPRKIPSVSGFLNSMETAVKSKWTNNGYRKLKLTDRQSETDETLPQSQNVTKGANSCYDRSKSCLEGCDECYDKQLYGWYGAIQRQLQRSQYQMQYSRPVQIVISAILLLCIIGVLAIRAI